MTTPSPPRWVQDAVFYQIFPDRFASSTRVPKPANLEPWDAPPTVHGYKGGDLWGIVEHLDYLQDLGISALYLNPVFRSACNHRYHPHDYYQVDPLLGGNEALEALLDQAHRRGIRVILDGVFNHVGRGFFPFHDILENGAASPWVDWFTVHEFPPNAYDPSRPPGYEAWKGLHPLPKLNHANPQVREYLMGVAEHWVRQGIDGWRLDVPAEIEVEGFWEEFRERVKAVNPEAYLVGEVWREATEWLRGDRFDGVMNYRFTEAVIAFVVGDRVRRELVAGRAYRPWPAIDGLTYAERIDRLLGLYPWASQLAQYNLLGSHDTARFLSIAGGDEASVRLGVLLLLTFPGAPSVYYGDEIGMEGGHDPDCRRAFPWHRPEAWNRGLLAHHRSLIALRHRHPALRSGSYHRVHADRDTYVFLRRGEDEAILVGVNVAEGSRRVAFPLDLPPGTWPAHLFGQGELKREGDLIELVLPPRSGGLWGWMSPTEHP